MKTQLRKDGAVTDEFMDMMSFISWQTSKSIKFGKGSPEEKQKAISYLLDTANSMLDVIDDTASSPVEDAGMRMGMAYAFAPLAENISDANKAEYESLMSNLKPDIQRFVD